MITGDRIKQARELRGLTQTELARHASVSQAAIAHFESGRELPSEGVLQAIAFQTGFPVAFFNRNPPPDFPLGSILFRVRSSVTSRQRSEVHQYGRLVFELAEEMGRHLTDIPLKLPRLKEGPLTAAKLTRSQLGLSPDTPIQHLIRLLEKSGVLLLSIPVALKGWDAFSVWAGQEQSKPVIAIIGEGSGDRLRYSVAHELGHLVMHQAMRGRLTDIEREANEFAAEFLMPADAIKREIRTPVTLTTLVPLKLRWRVSIQALVRRAYDLQLTSHRQYRYLMQQLTSRGWRTKEPFNLDIPIEKPRAVRKMAEVLYGKSVNYRKMASDFRIPTHRIREIIDAHATNAQPTSNQDEGKTQISGRLLGFPGRDRTD